MPYYPPASSTSPGGSDKQVQYNNAGAFGGDSFLTVDLAATPKRLATTGNFYVMSDGNNGFTLDGGGLSPAKNSWNIKQGSDGTFLFDQGGGMNGRFKLGDASSTYYDFTPDFSTSVLKVQGNGTVTTKNNTLDDGSGLLSVVDDAKLTAVGKGVYIKEGTNATMGTATLVAGTVVVNTTKVTNNSRIFLTAQSLGTVTVGQGLAVSARTAGTSFTITSQSATDTSVVAWQIVEPA